MIILCYLLYLDCENWLVGAQGRDVVSHYNVVINTNIGSVVNVCWTWNGTESHSTAGHGRFVYMLVWIGMNSFHRESYQACEAIKDEEHTSGKLWDMSSRRTSLNKACVQWRANIMWVKQMHWMVINLLADALRDPCIGELDSKKRWVAGIKGLSTQSGPLLPLNGATHGCEEWKGSKTRTLVLHSLLFYW